MDFPEPTQQDVNGENGDSLYNSVYKAGSKVFLSQQRKDFKQKLNDMFLPSRAKGKTTYPSDGGNSISTITLSGGEIKQFLFPLVDLAIDEWKSTPIELLFHAQAQIYFTVGCQLQFAHVLTNCDDNDNL